jgi:hypothetical protein
MSKPNNFGSIYDEHYTGQTIKYSVVNKETNEKYYEGVTDKLSLEGARLALHGVIHELTELNSKGKPYKRVKSINNKANQSLMRLHIAKQLGEPLVIKVEERF